MAVKRLLVLLLPLLLLLTAAARAAEVPAALRDALPEGLAEAAESGGVLAGGAAWLRETARASLDGLLRGAARNAALLTLAALLCGAAEGLSGGAGEEAARYVPFCGVLALSAIAAGDLRALLGLGARTVEELGTLAKLLLPSMAASMAAGGMVSSAGIWQVTTLWVCDLLSDAVARLLLPLVYCQLAAAAAGAALGEESLDRLAVWIKRLVSGALVAVMAAFTGYLSIAGVLSGSADRTAVRVAKAALSGGVPVVGGVLSDAAESVLAAAGTLRGTVGALSVLAILAACLTPLLRLGVQYALYQLAAFAAGIAGPKALGKYLERLGDAFALVFAMTASCAAVLLVALLVATSMAAG